VVFTLPFYQLSSLLATFCGDQRLAGRKNSSQFALKLMSETSASVFSSIMRGAYLGPDDRYPRWLYWTTLLMLAGNLALEVLFMVRLIHAKPRIEPYLYSKAAEAQVCAIICPAIMLPLVLLGMPGWLWLFAVTQVMALITTTGNWMGRSAIGEAPNGHIYGALVGWYLFCLVISLWYWIVRGREDDELDR
jgi:hypothetical protein